MAMSWTGSPSRIADNALHDPAVILSAGSQSVSIPFTPASWYISWTPSARIPELEAENTALRQRLRRARVWRRWATRRSTGR